MNRREFIQKSTFAGLALTSAAPLFKNTSAIATTGTVERVSLVKSGRPLCSIVLAPDAAEDEIKAAQELQQYLQKISGAKVSIGSQVEINQFPIYIGTAAATPQLLATIRGKGDDPASFALNVTNNEIRIAGLSPEGTRFGTYELLEQLGVRWFMPGDIGTVIPSTKNVQLPLQETIQVPSFTGRWLKTSKDFPEWTKHSRQGGPYFPGAHGIPGIKNTDFEAHPEYFALINGERVARQLDISNPDVVRIAIEETKEYFRRNPDAPWIGMGPKDGGGFCECDRCRALDGGDWDAFSNHASMTDRYIWFFNQVLDGISDEFPDKKIGFYSYHAYMRPPVKTKPNPRIVPAFAPIALCRIHGMNNPVCPERSYYKTLWEDWGKISPELYERGYWYELSNPSFFFSSVHKTRDEIPVAYKLGIKGWRGDTQNGWAVETPSNYIVAKLLWNHNADVDALLDDFYEKYFGPAKKPMAEYFTMMDAALRDGDYHTGSAWSKPHFFPAELRKKATRALNDAARRAGKSTFGERVNIFRLSFDYLESFISMIENQVRSDFIAARQDLAHVDQLQKVLLAYDPPMLASRSAANYLNRFFRQPVEQGFERVQAAKGNVVHFSEEWQFHLDQQRLGEDIGLWKTNVRGGNWRPLKTLSLSWGDQGLRYYKGEAWYRQTVETPAAFAGKRVFLWFGGVDEKAKVWVNGRLVGISHGAAFLPFEFDVTSAVKSGQTNVVAVRLSNAKLDELGTGGITAPVMLYVPAEGAEPDNVREESPTFP